MRRTLLALTLAASFGCATTNTAAKQAADKPLDALAERYVKLVLALGQHDENYVDAYYGPAAWADEAKAAKVPLAELAARADALIAEVDGAAADTEELQGRKGYLSHQLRALRARIRMLSGEKLSFDEESQALYDAQSPHFTEEELAKNVAALESAVPGTGPLAARLTEFRKEFILPKDKLDPVFRAAIAEARKRTLQHVQLPADETFTLEYVTGKSWGGYNWYRGNATSLIQINTDLPIYLWRAIDLAAHEGYPGHHVYNALLEQHLVKERGWVEFTVYPLFSPQSLIAEGSANYGIDIAFPDAEAYARDVLFPLAGLDPANAARYVQIEELSKKLDYAGNEVARRYLNGEMNADHAVEWLVKYALLEPDRAKKRLGFIDTYRSYVINYNVGQDLVRAYVEKQAATPEQKWDAFVKLLASPKLPSDLR